MYSIMIPFSRPHTTFTMLSKPLPTSLRYIPEPNALVKVLRDVNPLGLRWASALGLVPSSVLPSVPSSQSHRDDQTEALERDVDVCSLGKVRRFVARKQEGCSDTEALANAVQCTKGDGPLRFRGAICGLPSDDERDSRVACGSDTL